MDYDYARTTLLAEVEYGFSNPHVFQQKFSDSFVKSLSGLEDDLTGEAKFLLDEIRSQFDSYDFLSSRQREYLIEQTCLFFDDLKKTINGEFVDYYDEKLELAYLLRGTPAVSYLHKDIESEKSARNKKIMQSGKKQISSEFGDLQEYLEVERRHGFSDLAGKFVSESHFCLGEFPGIELIKSVEDMKFSEFICSVLGQPQDWLRITLRFRWRRISLLFSRYSTLQKEERKTLIDIAQNLIEIIPLEKFLMPEERPLWLDQFNPYVYCDTPPNSTPDEAPVNIYYVRRLSISYGSWRDPDIAGVASNNSIVRCFFEVYKRVPNNNDELAHWLEYGILPEYLPCNDFDGSYELSF
jgi:hypothetical protein